MQRIDHGIAPVLLFLISWGQENNYVSVDSIPFKIALERFTVDFDVLDDYGLGTGDDRRHFCLCLPEELRGRGKRCKR